jgi:hypothetical protein
MIRHTGIVVFTLLFTAACLGDSAATGPVADSARARDRAIVFVRSNYPGGGMDLGTWFEWEEAVVETGEPEPWIEHWYSAGDWVVAVGSPAVASDGGFYDVAITCPVTGFSWQGRVTTHGEVLEGPEQVLAACDAAIGHVDGKYLHSQLNNLTWIGRRTTPFGSAGHETFTYTAGDWVMTVSYPMTGPEPAICHIKLANNTTGFRWEGDMDPLRQLTETAAYSLVSDDGEAWFTPPPRFQLPTR